MSDLRHIYKGSFKDRPKRFDEGGYASYFSSPDTSSPPPSSTNLDAISTSQGALTDPISTSSAQSTAADSNMAAQNELNALGQQSTSTGSGSSGGGLLSPQNASLLSAVVGILGAAGHFAQSKSASTLPSMPAMGALPGLPGAGTGTSQYGPSGGYSYQNYTPAALAANGTAGLGYAPRSQTAAQPASSYYTYGSGPEQQFFQQVKPTGGSITPITGSKKGGSVKKYAAGGAFAEGLDPAYQDWEMSNGDSQPQGNKRGGAVARFDSGGALSAPVMNTPRPFTGLQNPAAPTAPVSAAPPPPPTAPVATHSVMGPPPNLQPSQTGISPSTGGGAMPAQNPGVNPPSAAVPPNANIPPAAPVAPVQRAPAPPPPPTAPRTVAAGALGAIRPPITSSPGATPFRPAAPPVAAAPTIAKPQPITNTGQQRPVMMRANGGIVPHFDIGGDAQVPGTGTPANGGEHFANTFGQYIPQINLPQASSGVTGSAPRGALADMIPKRGHNMLGQAAGGAQGSPQGHLNPNMMPSRHIQGPGDGTSDSIPARLANGEYVLSADVVSSLGNGDNGSGAKNLDQFVKNVRQHKAANAQRGTLPPDAKPIHQYMRGGQ
jgi:hypothetical protein